MSAVRISLPSRNKIPLPATSISTKQLCPGDDRSYTYISRMYLAIQGLWTFVCATTVLLFETMLFMFETTETQKPKPYNAVLCDDCTFQYHTNQAALLNSNEQKTNCATDMASKKVHRADTTSISNIECILLIRVCVLDILLAAVCLSSWPATILRAELGSQHHSARSSEKLAIAMHHTAIIP